MVDHRKLGRELELFSSDPLELATICDEVVVFHERRVCDTLSGDRLTPHHIL